MITLESSDINTTSRTTNRKRGRKHHQINNQHHRNQQHHHQKNTTEQSNQNRNSDTQSHTNDHQQQYHTIDLTSHQDHEEPKTRIKSNNELPIITTTNHDSDINQRSSSIKTIVPNSRSLHQIESLLNRLKQRSNQPNMSTVQTTSDLKKPITLPSEPEVPSDSPDPVLIRSSSPPTDQLITSPPRSSSSPPPPCTNQSSSSPPSPLPPPPTNPSSSKPKNTSPSISLSPPPPLPRLKVDTSHHHHHDETNQKSSTTPLTTLSSSKLDWASLVDEFESASRPDELPDLTEWSLDCTATALPRRHGSGMELEDEDGNKKNKKKKNKRTKKQKGGAKEPPLSAIEPMTRMMARTTIEPPRSAIELDGGGVNGSGRSSRSSGRVEEGVKKKSRNKKGQKAKGDESSWLRVEDSSGSKDFRLEDISTESKGSRSERRANVGTSGSKIEGRRDESQNKEVTEEVPKRRSKILVDEDRSGRVQRLLRAAGSEACHHPTSELKRTDESEGSEERGRSVDEDRVDRSGTNQKLVRSGEELRSKTVESTSSRTDEPVKPKVVEETSSRIDEPMKPKVFEESRSRKEDGTKKEFRRSNINEDRSGLVQRLLRAGEEPRPTERRMMNESKRLSIGKEIVKEDERSKLDPGGLKIEILKRRDGSESSGVMKIGGDEGLKVRKEKEVDLSSKDDGKRLSGSFNKSSSSGVSGGDLFEKLTGLRKSPFVPLNESPTS